MPARKIRVELTTRELDLLREALDSHAYWQLSDEQYRHDGFVYDKTGPEGNSHGSDDPDTQKAIDRCYRLEARLARLMLRER